MRVLLIANHNPAAFGPGFEAQALADGWRSGAPHVEVEPFAFSHCEPGIAQVWQAHAARVGGFSQTAFLDACDPSPAQSPAAFSQDLAAQLYEAVRSKMSRIVVALPQYLEPDAGVAFLTELGRLIQPEGGAGAQSGTGPHSTLGEVDPERAQELVNIIGIARQFLAKIDVVGAYASNMPLLGMHGMNGAAALEGHLAAEVAQGRERQVNELFHLMQGPYAALDAADNSGSATILGLAGPNNQEPKAPSLKDLTRHDGGGAGGGLGFALATLGARLLPAAQVFGTQFDLPARIAASDLVVVYQKKLDGRTFPDQVGHWAAQLATSSISPVIVLSNEQIMSVRELSGQQVASAYQVAGDSQSLFNMAQRLAKSWTPNRS